MENFGVLLVICVIVVILFATLIAILSRYRKCPSDKILVIYGKVGTDEFGQPRSAKCIHGGAAFIVPVIQSYQYLDLTPISMNVDLKNALSKQNIRINVPSRFTVGISTEPGVMQNAAERLLGLKLIEIQELARDIIFGQLRLIIATMDIEEINADRDKFLVAISKNVEIELKKIGLRLINVNVTDITDESGYLEALGKEAAAKAVNDAKKSVAEKNRDGEIGQANAQQEQRVQVSAANAAAIEGENKAKVAVAQSEAVRREREAEALRQATAAEAVQSAKAKQEAYAAQQEAEMTRAELEKATQKADVIVKAEIAKEQAEIAAEAEAEVTRRKARGEADAIFAKMEAEAKGQQEILTRQAEGMKKIVEAAGGDANAAVKLLIAEKIEDLVSIQVEAIKNIKIDKITVWDSGKGADGKTSTADFISGMMQSVPPLNELFKQAGMELPDLLGKEHPEEAIEVPAISSEITEEENKKEETSVVEKQVQQKSNAIKTPSVQSQPLQSKQVQNPPVQTPPVQKQPVQSQPEKKPEVNPEKKPESKRIDYSILPKDNAINLEDLI